MPNIYAKTSISRQIIDPNSTALLGLTVLWFLFVIMSLSGQKLLSYPIYPKVRVYPREVCTHNNGSLGPPWGLLGGPQNYLHL